MQDQKEEETLESSYASIPKVILEILLINQEWGTTILAQQKTGAGAIHSSQLSDWLHPLPGWLFTFNRNRRKGAFSHMILKISQAETN